MEIGKQQGVTDMKFIYVFTENDKSKLLERGFKLLKSDPNKSFFIFKNEETEDKFDLSNIKICFSDILSF